MFFNKTKKLLQEASLEIDVLKNDLQVAKSELHESLQKNNILLAKYSAYIEKDLILENKQAEIDQKNAILIDLDNKYKTVLGIYKDLETEVDIFQDSLEIGSFGLYKRQFSLDSSESFKSLIEENYEKQKKLIKEDKAAVCYTEWTVGGSKAEGRKMTNQYKRLMLFAFNGECDGLIAKVKWNNVEKTKDRILKVYESINKLGIVQNVNITKDFFDLKLEELILNYEFEQKKYEEKEEQRRIREQMREEEKAQKELEKAQREAEEDEKRFEKALEKARKELSSNINGNVNELNEQIRILEERLSEAHQKKERAMALAQLTKVGHIYIISNIGSFGENIYKIGMTRRLDPLDRVKELGDASVPFQFDIHAIIYSENAPQLESQIHKEFSNKRLNRVNNKKEFFNVTLKEIEQFIKQSTNADIEFTMIAEAREYRETKMIFEKLGEGTHDDPIISKFPSSLI